MKLNGGLRKTTEREMGCIVGSSILTYADRLAAELERERLQPHPDTALVEYLENKIASLELEAIGEMR